MVEPGRQEQTLVEEKRTDFRNINTCKNKLDVIFKDYVFLSSVLHF